MSVDTQNRVSYAENSLRNKATTPSGSPEELKKQDFMNLFMTQMSHQDPMNPMDSGAMMTQLAQLGSMEQLENMNGQLKDMNNTQKDISRFQALRFLDKDVMMKTDSLEFVKGSGSPVYYMLDQDYDDLKITIEDMDGAPVFSKNFGLTTAGKHEFVWDGKNNEGVLMGDGKYNAYLMGTKVDGSSFQVALFNSGRVSQVEYKNGQPWVKVNNGTVPLSKVMAVDNKSNRLFGNSSPLPIIQELEPKEIFEEKSIKNVAE